MTTLPDFEADAKDALLEQMEAQADDVGQELKDAIDANFQDYAGRQGYSIEHIWQDSEGPNTTRSGDTVTTSIHYPELTGLFEWGVQPHTIEGNPLLSFAWPSPPEGTRPEGAPSHVVSEGVNWGSVTGGIDESRAIRSALSYIRFQLEGEVTL